MFACCCVDEKPEAFAELQTDTAFPARGGKEVGDSMFEVNIERKPGTYFGVDLSSAEKACVVTTVTDDGLIADWNKTAAVEQQVRKFDRLVAVNGHTSEKSKDSWPVSGGLHEAGEAFGALTGSQVRLLGAKPAALGRVGLCQPTKSPPKHSNMSRHACSLGISW
eukprot:g2809.t1